MNRERTSYSIPIDLVLDILSRMPTKSVTRFRCVSKQWNSMLRSPYFTELFMTKSSARPHLLFAVERKGELIFFSPTQPKNSYENSSLVVATGFHKRFHEDVQLEFCGYASGLVCFRMVDEVTIMHVICNPSTGKCLNLPKLRAYRNSYSFFGFDPVEKQFKILHIVYGYDDNRILTLGTGETSWRKIQCRFIHKPMDLRGIQQRICINGVLYYLVGNIGEARPTTIVCFDVRSEKLKFISTKVLNGFACKLINYKGKLGGIYRQYGYTSGGRRTIELFVCVLEDIDKQEWSESVYTFPEDIIVDPFSIFIVGVTATGEIVLAGDYTSKPFYVFYFNPVRNSLQYVEIQSNHEAFEVNNNRVYTFVDHVEDVRFNYEDNITSISSPEEKGKPTSTPKPYI